MGHMEEDIETSTVDAIWGTGAVRELTDERPVSQAVVATVAELTDRDPTAMDPLYDWIDPDALDDLFERPSSRATVCVSFRYLDCIVAVTNEGFVHASLDGDYPN